LLRWRLLSAALLLTVFCGFLSLDYFQIPPLAAPGVWLLPILLLVTVLTARELIELLAAKQMQPRLLSTYAGVLLVAVSAMVPMVWPLFGRSYPPDCSLGQFGWPLMGFVGAEEEWGAWGRV
jgi:phosphatidate cytidylyltransferase